MRMFKQDGPNDTNRSTDGARAQKIPRVHWATGDAVVDELLLHCPVHVLQQYTETEHSD